MPNRRQILKTLGTGLALSVIPYSAIAATGTGQRYGMLIDVRRCTGCQSCQVSCAIENGTPPGRCRTAVKRMSVGSTSKKSLMVPMQCAQCANPTCTDVCPVQATGKLDNGIVYIDHNECIGCQMCTEACPYGARIIDDSFSAPPEKCNFCYHRLEQGLLPACVESCVGSARIFGDLNDPESQITKRLKENTIYTLLKDKNTQPSIFYIGLPEGMDQTIINLKEVEWQR